MSFLHTIPCLLIHRAKDTVRDECIRELETSLDLVLERFEGISGDFLIADGYPTKHPYEKTPTSPGNIGCTASHVEILESAIKSKHPYVCIFEDDAEVVGDVDAYLNDINMLPPGDIILLGTNEIVDGVSTENPSIKKVTRFWGTHAVIVNRRGVLGILTTYKRYVDMGVALPADWLYSYAIKEEGLTAYAPVKSVIRQKPGFISFISGKVRK
jgi:GR25 family glycosyltransferase involved in LPS biosynthesis